MYKGLGSARILTSKSIWLLDLAKCVPASTRLDGFDISNAGYPQKSWLPSNVTLQEMDASKEPPINLQGKYDVVHIRLFLIVVEDNDPMPFLKHCIKLLRLPILQFSHSSS